MLVRLVMRKDEVASTGSSSLEIRRVESTVASPAVLNAEKERCPCDGRLPLSTLMTRNPSESFGDTQSTRPEHRSLHIAHPRWSERSMRGSSVCVGSGRFAWRPCVDSAHVACAESMRSPGDGQTHPAHTVHIVWADSNGVRARTAPLR